jgi:hypothetical protein
MRTPETFTLLSAFVENADQVDGGITGGEVFSQYVRVEDVTLDQGNAGINNERTMTFTTPRQDAYPVAMLCQPVDQVPADEAGTAQDANCFVTHGDFCLSV